VKEASRTSKNRTATGAGEAFEALLDIIRRLRAPDGCPWDRVQTLQSLKTYCIEEAYEVVQAIEDGDREELREELGDLLMQVVFQADLAADEGAFDIAGVCNGAVKKLIDRHPHVFGDKKAKDAAEVLDRWEKYKRREGRGVLSGVPRHLPALMMALRMSEKVSHVGFDWPDETGAIEKLDEEILELKEALAGKDDKAVEEELGDVLFTVANVARMRGVNPEEALRRMMERFKRRFEYVEAELAKKGEGVKGTPLPTLETLWEDAKRFAQE